MPVSALLVASPWRFPGEPPLGLALLRGILERAGVAAENLHATLLYPLPTEANAALDATFRDRYGGLLFAPCLDGGPSAAAARDAILSRYCDDVSLQGLRPPLDLALRLQALAAPIDAEIAQARLWLERATAAVLASPHPVVCFSVMFESQLPATLALAQRLKAARPELRIALGGAACQQEQGEGLLASFPCLDAVCYTEGEPVIAALVRALAGEGELAAVPGLCYRDCDGLPQKTAPPPLVHDLDALPPVRYDEFFAQLAASPWREVPVRLSFETARGCWWGQKHLCTFCGLNGEGLPFRAKSPRRAFAEIRDLYRDYPRAHYLLAADNILAMSYFDTVLPQLAALPREPGRPLQIFYEIKSNLQPAQIELLAAAGVRTVQPGIESFSDGVLRLMDKGASALGQVQFLKWATQAGVAATYNILMRNPGETAQDYHRMLELIEKLHHLPPPSGLVLTEIERFSPYHRDPARYGLSALRPHDFYRTIFPDSQVDLSRIAYQFDYQHACKSDGELLAAYRALGSAVDRWRQEYREGLAYYVDLGEYLQLVDLRAAAPRVLLLSGVPAALFRFIDRNRSFAAICAHFSEIAPEVLLAQLERWQHLRLIYATPPEFDDAAERRFLALLPRRGRSPSAAKPKRRQSLEVFVR